MKRVRVGLVGAGFFAQFHLEAWLRLCNAELVGICDRDREKLAAVPTHVKPNVKTYDCAETMLGDLELDLLDVATPPSTHHELVRLAAHHGVDVVCQKPLAPTWDEARALVSTAGEAGIKLIVHENIRFAPWHREIAKLITTERLGRLHSITMRLRPGDGQGPKAYLNRQPYFQHMPRFLVHETAIHWVDTFRYLMGEVRGVFARLGRLNPAIAGEDVGQLIFEFDHGAYGVFDGNRLNGHDTDNPRRTMGELWLEGERGVVRLDGTGRLWWQTHGEREGEHQYDWNDQSFAGDAVHALQDHVLRHLLRGEPVENDGEAYLRNLMVEEAIYRSHQERRWVAV